MAGALSGIRVVEMAGLAPGPYACMIMADMGAEVIRVDRCGGGSGVEGMAADVTGRGRKSIALNLKSPQAVELLLQLLETADVLVEGFRPGVMEKLGLGPEVCLARNPGLIYGRMTGWGQSGPLAKKAGHDINYIAISGALAAFGDADRPPPTPLNVIGDMGGGAMFLLSGILAALLERQRSGLGQVVDAAISDGTASLMATVHGLKGVGFWEKDRDQNILDGGAPFYRSYQCSDGKYICFGAIEPPFYADMLRGLDLADALAACGGQMDKAAWPGQRELVAQRVAQKTRQEWIAVFAELDACFAPVLDMDEAELFEHNRERGALLRREGVLHAAVVPRLSRTPGELGAISPAVGADSRQVFAALGLDEEQLVALAREGVIAVAEQP